MDCNCPAPSTLTEIIAELCGVDLGQVQKIGFQRPGFNFNASADPAQDILELATWQALKTADDATKVVVTPLIGADPTIEAGEAITTGGGDNSTLNGAEEVEGVNPSLFSTMFKSLSSKVERAMQALNCERNLVVYFFLQGGRIAVAEVTPDTPGIYKGFDVTSFFMSDRNNAGYGTKDTHSMRFSLSEGYSNNLVILKPNFNPLTEL